MLRWRLPLGILIIAALVGLCWADHVVALPGAVLLPLAVLLVVVAGSELLEMLASVGLQPSPTVVHFGNIVVVIATWLSFLNSSLPTTQYPLLALAAAVVILFAAELRRRNATDAAVADVAAGVFAVGYLGVMMSVVVALRMAWGIGALAAMLIVVKLGDTGAYFVGSLIGRHKLAPRISPGKTVEGAVGALVFSALGSWAAFRWLVPLTAADGMSHGTVLGWVVFGVAVSAAGMIGDLAESLVKRGAGRKDSNCRLFSKSFGGVLDLLDSVLLAAPVAYAFWAAGSVG